MIWRHFSTSLRETFPTRASEWALAVMLFLWGIVLAVNVDLFTESRSFSEIARVFGQSTLSWMCLAAGGGRLAMLAVNGAWRRSPHLRAIGAFVSAGFWFMISMGFLQAGTFGTGLAVYPVLFLLDAYNVIRAAGDAGTADRPSTAAGAQHGTGT